MKTRVLLHWKGADVIIRSKSVAYGKKTALLRGKSAQWGTHEKKKKLLGHSGRQGDQFNPLVKRRYPTDCRLFSGSLENLKKNNVPIYDVRYALESS